MGFTDIRQLLPKNVYDAAVGANAPSAANVYATIADVGGGGGSSVGTSNEFQITNNSGGFLASVIQQSGTHIIPTTTQVTDLGSATNRFNNLFINSTLDYSINALIFKANNVTKITFGDQAGTVMNLKYNLFLNGSDIRFALAGNTSVIKEDGGNNKLSLYNVDTKLRFRSDNNNEGKGIYIGPVGTILPFDNSNDSAIVIIDSTTQGFMQPSMTIAQRTAIASPLAGLQVHTEDGTDSIPYYNHSVDGWVPVGRYAGNFLTGAGAVNNQQIQGVNLSGELIGLRVGLDSSSNIIPLNPSGVPFTNAANLGTASTTWGSVYSSNFYAGNSSTYARYFFGSTGSMGALLGNSGTANGGIRLTANTGSICFFKFCNASTVDKQGLIISEAKNGLSNLATTSEIEPTAILELQGKTKGFLPPRMTTVEMNAISVTASSTGLMIYDETTNQWMGYNGTSWVILG